MTFLSSIGMGLRRAGSLFDELFGRALPGNCIIRKPVRIYLRTLPRLVQSCLFVDCDIRSLFGREVLRNYLLRGRPLLLVVDCLWRERSPTCDFQSSRPAGNHLRRELLPRVDQLVMVRDHINVRIHDHLLRRLRILSIRFVQRQCLPAVLVRFRRLLRAAFLGSADRLLVRRCRVLFATDEAGHTLLVAETHLLGLPLVVDVHHIVDSDESADAIAHYDFYYSGIIEKEAHGYQGSILAKTANSLEPIAISKAPAPFLTIQFYWLKQLAIKHYQRGLSVSPPPRFPRFLRSLPPPPPE